MDFMKPVYGLVEGNSAIATWVIVALIVLVIVT